MIPCSREPYPLLAYLTVRMDIGNPPTMRSLPDDFSEFIAPIAESNARKERVFRYLDQLKQEGLAEEIGGVVRLTPIGTVCAAGIGIFPECMAQWEKQLKRLEVWPSSVST